jgi:hypothetical protein
MYTDHATALGLDEMREIVDRRAYNNEFLMKLCVDVVLYYAGGFKANADGIVTFYREAISVIGPSVTFYNVDGREVMRKRKRDTLDMLPFWAEPTTEERGFYGLHLESGPTAGDISDRAFRFYDDGLGYIRMMLPLEFVTDGGHALAALALGAAARLRFSGGSGGYAVNMYDGFDSSAPNGPVFAISRRFRGIDFGEPLWLRRLHEHGIKCVNWLTFLGEAHVARLGDLDKLRAALGRDITVHELPHGVMIQAGPAPGFGDVNRRERLELYHQVGRVVEPVRFKSDVFKRWSDVGGGENTAEWLARFDE